MDNLNSDKPIKVRVRRKLAERPAHVAPRQPQYPDDFLLTFGKHQGRRLIQVVREGDGAYIDWLTDCDDPATREAAIKMRDKYSKKCTPNE